MRTPGPSNVGRASALVLAALLLASSGDSHSRAENRAEEPGLPVGAPMEDFGLRELDFASGRLKGMVWLSNFAGQAAPEASRRKLVLLNFFASWCKPCRAELEALATLQARYATHGLQVLSVNFRHSDESIETAIRATRDLLSGVELGFPMLFDRYTTRAQLVYMGSRAILPCTIFIDGSGKITRRLQGAEATRVDQLDADVRSELGLPASGEVP